MPLPLALKLLVVALVALQRLGELLLARRWLRQTGGAGAAVAEPEPAYAAMVAVHVAWLGGCALEPWLAPWPEPPALAWAGAAVWAGSVLLRVWTLRTLGRYWHVRVVRRAQQPVITHGPYRYLRHPNYLVVILEIVAVPVLLGAYATAALACAANAAVLAVRIRREEAYLFTWPAYRAAFQHKKRLLPGLF